MVLTYFISLYFDHMLNSMFWQRGHVTWFESSQKQLLFNNCFLLTVEKIQMK